MPREGSPDIGAWRIADRPGNCRRNRCGRTFPEATEQSSGRSLFFQRSTAPEKEKCYRKFSENYWDTFYKSRCLWVIIFLTINFYF